MRRRPFIVGALLLAGSSLWAAATEFRVVVNRENPVSAVTRDELSDLFLKKVTSWSSGTHALPVDQAEGAVRWAFARDIHHRSAAAIRAYWQQRIFSGRDVPPPERENDEDVLAFVRRNPGAVGYVSAAAATDGVKVLEVRR